MNKKLREVYGDCDGLLETIVTALEKHEGTKFEKPIKSRLLTDGDVDNWDAYQEIGTVEECREAREKQKPKKPKAHESIVSGVHAYLCPYCERYIGSSIDIVPSYCDYCGQAIDTENLEEMEDE